LRNVEQDNIQIAIKGKMLKSIVQQVHGWLKTLLADYPRAQPVRRNNDGYIGQRSGQRRRLVTDLPRIGNTIRAGFKNYETFSSAPSVTAREDARAMSACQQRSGNQDHQWCLACSAHTQVAYTYDRAVQTADFEPPATIGEVA
jgi:hypothetical protein